MAQESVDLPSARGQRITYRSFLLRLRRSHATAPWRLALQNTLTGEIQSFTNSSALLMYLLAVMERQLRMMYLIPSLNRTCVD